MNGGMIKTRTDEVLAERGYRFTGLQKIGVLSMPLSGIKEKGARVE